MDLDQILIVLAISAVAIFVIFKFFKPGPGRWVQAKSRDNVAGKTIVVHGKPALGVSVAAHPTATAANRATVARARQRGRVSRDESVDTSLTDALILSTVLNDQGVYEPELPQPSPEPEYVPASTPEPQPYCPPEPDTYRAPDPTPSYDSTPTYDSSPSSCDSSPSYSSD